MQRLGVTVAARSRRWELIEMATLDRIESAYVPWTPSVSGLGIADESDDYVGRHRKPARRRLSLLRLFYLARHRTR